MDREALVLASIKDGGMLAPKETSSSNERGASEGDFSRTVENPVWKPQAKAQAMCVEMSGEILVNYREE